MIGWLTDNLLIFQGESDWRGSPPGTPASQFGHWSAEHDVRGICGAACSDSRGLATNSHQPMASGPLFSWIPGHWRGEIWEAVRELRHVLSPDVCGRRHAVLLGPNMIQPSARGATTLTDDKVFGATKPFFELFNAYRDCFADLICQNHTFWEHHRFSPKAD